MDYRNNQTMSKPVMVSNNNIAPLLVGITLYMEDKGVQLTPLPKVVINRDNQYEFDPFGKTAYYDPENRVVVLFVAGRHIKDVLRSFAHEMIHHNQNLTGMFNSSHLGALEDPRYAENDEHLNNMEKDAYLRGNIFFRSWEDGYK